MKITGGYDAMISHIAELEKVSAYKTLDFKDLAEAKKSVKGYQIILEKMGLKFTEPKREMRKGGFNVLVVRPYIDPSLSIANKITALKNNSPIDIPIDSNFDRIYAVIRKSLNDFTIIPEYTGKAKICEGGGWYSNGSRYKVGELYFEY